MGSSNSLASWYKEETFPVQRSSSPPSLADPHPQSPPPSSTSASELPTITTNSSTAYTAPAFTTTTFSTTTTATTSTDGDHPSRRHPPFSHRPFPLVTPTHKPSCLITPCPSSSRSTVLTLPTVIPTTTAGPDQYDWRPILLTPPPTVKRGDSSTLSYTSVQQGRDTPTLSKQKSPPKCTFDYPPKCNDAWPLSPTLSTKRARKHSHRNPSHASLRVAVKRIGEKLSSGTMASSSSSQVPLHSSVPSKDSQFDSHHLDSMEPTRSSVDTHRMLPPFKPRALTLDGIDRPNLPSMLGYHPTPHPIRHGHGHAHAHGSGHRHSRSMLGPIRASPSRSFSSFRNGPEYRSNPYFVSTPGRRYIDHTRSTPSLSPKPTREASYFDNCTAVNSSSSSTPWTPTSSVRSTSSGVYQHHHDVFASSHTPSRSSLATPPLHLDHSSPNGSLTRKSDSIELPALPGVPEAALPNNLSFHHHHHHQRHPACVHNNALGLYMDSAPFPPELLRLDLGHRAHQYQGGRGGSWIPRSEADGYFGPSALTRHSPIRSRPSYALTHSPAPMSDFSPQMPWPISGEDVLPKLSLGHRHGLDSNMSLPALLRPISIVPSQSLPFQRMAERADGDRLYKMPVLRSMSPFADMSSDSDDEEEEEEEGKDEQDQSKTPSSSLTTLSDSHGSAASGSKAEQKRVVLPEEGCTGEIFRKIKTQLPITLKQGSGSDAKEEHLFCKLDSTTHQCFSVVDGKWACYRRNYLKIDVVFYFEDASGQRRDNVAGDLILQTHPTSRHPIPFVIDHFAVHISAHILDLASKKLQRGRQGTIPLIQFGPARERGPREPVQPASLRPGGNITKDATANEHTSTRAGNIAAFRRVQIRSATMNNGQRGAAGQQFYALKMTLLAYPRDCTDGVEVASIVSEPITVRGRSKVHYAPPNGGGADDGQAATTEGKGKKAAVSRSRARSVSTAQSIRSETCSARSNSTLTSRRQHTSSASKRRSEYEQHRRSTRLLLAANNSGSNNREDAGDESEVEVASTTRNNVMHIQNVL
ncbi:hypothetical protein NDA18_002601 [Ustilago nuda]|nr:hypothetical protein NDA18_002601 [Ustilago nuda]